MPACGDQPPRVRGDIPVIQVTGGADADRDAAGILGGLGGVLRYIGRDLCGRPARRRCRAGPGFPSNRGDFCCGDHCRDGAGLGAPAPGGAGSGLPAFPAPRGSSGLRGQGRSAGPSRAARCAAPLRPEGRPRTLSGRSKASGGEAASIVRPAQRARRAHAASFPASDRS